MAILIANFSVIFYPYRPMILDEQEPVEALWRFALLGFPVSTKPITLCMLYNLADILMHTVLQFLQPYTLQPHCSGIQLLSMTLPPAGFCSTSLTAAAASSSVYTLRGGGNGMLPSAMAAIIACAHDSCAVTVHAFTAECTDLQQLMQIARSQSGNAQGLSKTSHWETSKPN